MAGHGERSAKSRSPVPRDNSASSHISAGELPGNNGAVSDVERSVAAAFDAQRANLESSLTAAVLAGVKGPVEAVVEAAFKSQMGAVEGRLTSLEEGQSKVLRELSKVNATLAQLSHSPSLPQVGSAPGGAMAACSQPDVTTSPFFRALDPTILYCNVHGRAQVPRTEFHKAIVPLAADANLGEDKFKITGDALDDRFEIQFLGDRKAASAAATQFMQSLYLGRGKWKTQEALDATSGLHKFYVANDKNGAQVRREILAKGLKQILESLCINKTFYVRKASGSILVDRRVLATVFITSETSAHINWFHPKRIELGIELEQVVPQFSTLVGDPSSP